MKRIILFLSGKGSDLVNLLYWSQLKLLKKTRVVAVVVDRVCPALYTAQSFNIDTLFYSSENKFVEQLKTYKPSYLLMSGFLKILPKKFIKEFSILNIHPSLLPSLRGKDPQKQAIDKGLKVTGVTIHIVTEEVDNGPILFQTKVPIAKYETEQTLCHKLQLVASAGLLIVLKKIEEGYLELK